MNQLNDQFNAAMMFRTGEAFSIFGDLGSAPGIQATSAAGTRLRWRFTFRTPPYAHALLARAVMFPPSSNYSNDTYSTLRIYSDATESTLVKTEEFHYGPGPAGNTSVGGWMYHRICDRFIEGLDPSTQYWGLVSDVDYGRIQSMAIANLQSMEDYSGYLPNNMTEQTEIVDALRENLVSAIPGIWKHSGVKVFNWSTNLQASPKTNATTTLQNVLDTSVTTVSAASPGWTLDLRYKNRLSQTTVPCVLNVCGSWLTGGGEPDGMDVSLKDSGGNVLASIDDGWSSTTPKWVSVAFNAPALLDKWDLQFNNGGAAGTASIYAACVFQYET